MRILQVCKKPPFPLNDGESIAVYGMAKGMHHRGHQVHLLFMNTSKHYRSLDNHRDKLLHYDGITEVKVSNEITASLLLKSIFSSEPLHVQRIKSKQFQKAYQALIRIKKFDLILFETVFTSYVLNDVAILSTPKILMRCHNAEHVILERLASLMPYWKRWYFRLQSQKVKSYERRVLSNVDMIVALSEADKNALSGLDTNINISVNGIGLDLSRYPMGEERQRSTKTKFFYIGSLDWQPNVQGLEWFLEEVWSSLDENILKNVELHIAGNQVPKSIRKITEASITLHGYVDDAISYMAEMDVMIVPLFAGSGQKVKVLEALTLGKKVVTTPIGAEGIRADKNKLIIANSAKQFQDIISNFTELSLAKDFNGNLFEWRSSIDFKSKCAEIEAIIVEKSI